MTAASQLAGIAILVIVEGGILGAVAWMIAQEVGWRVASAAMAFVFAATALIYLGSFLAVGDAS